MFRPRRKPQFAILLSRLCAENNILSLDREVSQHLACLYTKVSFLKQGFCDLGPQEGAARTGAAPAADAGLARSAIQSSTRLRIEAPTCRIRMRSSGLRLDAGVEGADYGDPGLGRACESHREGAASMRTMVAEIGTPEFRSSADCSARASAGAAACASAMLGWVGSADCASPERTLAGGIKLQSSAFLFLARRMIMGELGAMDAAKPRLLKDAAARPSRSSPGEAGERGARARAFWLSGKHADHAARRTASCPEVRERPSSRRLPRCTAIAKKLIGADAGAPAIVEATSTS
jgi:hypothetical protein